jgi:hypothetical protein
VVWTIPGRALAKGDSTGPQRACNDNNWQGRESIMETNIRETIRGRMDELKTLRDEIRVDMKLAGMDLRDEWKKLEKRIPETTRLASDIKTLTVEALDEVLAEVRRFRACLGERPPGPGKTTSQS